VIVVRIAMVQGRADPALDGVADYTRRLTEALRDGGVDVVGVPFDGLRDAARRVRAAAPDVVHVQFAPSAYRFSARPGLLPDLVRPPVVTTLHEYGWWSAPSWVPEPVWRALERRGWFDRETGRLAPRSAAAVTTNAGHAGALARRLRVDAVRVPLAPNVDDHGADPGARARLGIPADAQVVAFFGFVHPVKGVRHLVDAVAALRAQGRPVHLLVVGGFTSLALPEDEAAAFRAELEEHVRGRGAPVTITGHLPAPEVSALLHASDVAAFPFTAGATTKSGAVLSAFAHGLPVVVTAADPPDPELVDGETVVVAPRVRDGDALAGALSRLLDDPGLRARVAAGGAALGAERTWPRIAAAHRDLYAGVLGG
jgi:glycosyltransferase involved in cell wall biosynthesis